MKRAGSVLAIVLGTLLLVVCVIGAWRGDRAHSAPTSGSADCPVGSAYPSTPVAQEIGELGGAHDWAGRYLRGTGYGGDDVCLAPRAGFIRWSTQDFPPYELNVRRGDIIERDGQLHLRDPSALDDVDVLVAVHWGPRRFLLAPFEVGAFCSALQTGEEPRVGTIGRFLLREGDERRDAGPISSVEPKDLCH